MHTGGGPAHRVLVKDILIYPCYKLSYGGHRTFAGFVMIQVGEFRFLILQVLKQTHITQFHHRAYA